ncbi:hypothetical protein Heshes_06860 [Alicyclobacillus hesperidum]|uniref:Uncharacterized protein n=1 Tax=Alicyclobacillus hesperidum TaxID=89784 RepID=A0AA37U852_9BACL|nr:hypothetical protein Heshes_06860 [Alicyclobacillus hesperidum]
MRGRLPVGTADKAASLVVSPNKHRFCYNGVRPVKLDWGKGIDFRWVCNLPSRSRTSCM